MGKSKGIGDAWRARRWERWLLAFVFVAVAVGYAMVLLVRFGESGEFASADFAPLGAFGASLIALHVLFFATGFRGDPVLLAAALLLSGLGIVEQFRLGTIHLSKADSWATFAFPIGVGAMAFAALLFGGGRYRWLEKTSTLCGIAAIAVIAATLAMGHKFRGATYAAGNMTPTEVIKILLPVFLAGFFAAYRSDLAQTALPGLPAPSTPTVIALGFFWGVPMALLFLQHDLGMILLLNAVFLVLLSLAARRFGYLFIGGLVAAAAAMAALHFVPHVQARVEAWSDPFRDTTGKGFQIMQSLTAFNSGGLWGSGLGGGHPQAIPIASSDFVYAAMGEEAGFVGCALAVLVYLVFFYRGYRIADSAKDPFAQFLAAGLISIFAFQTLLNIGGVTKALPLTGITLPFVSHGGSSLVTSFAALGLLLAMSEGEGRGGRVERAPIPKRTADKKKNAGI